MLDCPLCAVDDVYSLSYGARELTKKEDVADEADDDEEASY